MNNIKISPSVLAADLSCLGDEIARVVEGGCDDIHIDIMDGHFVPNISFGPSFVATVRRLTYLPLDVHLMVDNPLDMISPFADAGSTYLTIHVEACDDVPSILSTISDHGVRPGISFRPDTHARTVIPYLNLVDIVLVMSVYPGFGGQKMIEPALAKAKRLRELSPEMNVEVDGGINADTIAHAASMGANEFVAGSAIFKSDDLAATIATLRRLAEESYR